MKLLRGLEVLWILCQQKRKDELKERYQFHPKIVEALAGAIYLLGKQGLTLCSHIENLENETNENQGNFLTLVRGFVLC